MISIQKLYSTNKNARVLRLSNTDKKLLTPTYFPALSSVEVSIEDIGTLINLIMSSSYPRILISSYDIFKMKPSLLKKTEGEICNYIRSHGFVMLDSGIFESYWKENNSWKFKNYAKIVQKINSDFYFSFDALPLCYPSEQEYIRSVLRYFNRSVSLNEKGCCIPIIHGVNPQRLISLVQKFINDCPDYGNVIAVPERDCGNTFVERANTILNIRRILDKKNRDNMIHILGCGNPISIATYSFCGADIFDSVDWNRILIEPDELRIYDFVQFEMLSCNCYFCSRIQVDPINRASLHNLLFYQNYVIKIQKMIRDNTLYDFLLYYIGKKVLKKIGR